MMAKPKSKKVKKKNQNAKPIKSKVPATLPPELVMDGTPHTEITVMQNMDYASEIIQGAQEAFNLKRLKQEKKKGINNFLWEGERQIFKLWHSVVALDSRVKSNQPATLFKTFEKREKLEQFLDQTFQYSYRDLISKGDFEKRSIVNLYYFWQMENYINSLK